MLRLELAGVNPRDPQTVAILAENEAAMLSRVNEKKVQMAVSPFSLVPLIILLTVVFPSRKRAFRRRFFVRNGSSCCLVSCPRFVRAFWSRPSAAVNGCLCMPMLHLVSSRLVSFRAVTRVGLICVRARRHSP